MGKSECNHLHHIFQNSEEIGSYCDQWRNPLIGSQYLVPFKIIDKHFSSNAKKRVLDWGCGDGHLSYYLCKQDLFVNAFSFDELGKIQPFLTKKYKGSFDFYKGDQSNPVLLPYPSNTFEAVFSVGVLEHVRETGGNELSSLYEINRILKPGGQLFVFHFPNKFSWIEFVNRNAKKIGLTNKYVHNFLYRKKEILSLAKQSNFDVLEIGIYNLFPRNLFRSFSLLKKSQKLHVESFVVLERFFSFFFKEFSQNYYFVLKKSEERKN